MNTKWMSILAAAALGLSTATGAHASGFAQCASTDMVKFEGSIVDAALATPELSALVQAVAAAGLGEALDTLENITVYAPTNDAFAALPVELLEAVLSDGDMLTAVLTYHVSEGIHDPRKYVTVARRSTLQGQTVYYGRSNGAARVNNAAITCQGVEADNGVVWIIDSVLLPNL